MLPEAPGAQAPAREAAASEALRPGATALSRLAPLLALYFAQGLPFGFQATALPILLRQRGASLQSIGFASLLAAPWLAKALWAPAVDRYWSARLGRRKSWILPMQGGLVVCALVAARTHSVGGVCALVFAMNLCAATQDIAVDALAVTSLQPHELGLGNAFQVVGYKLGMLTGGGLLVWAMADAGFSGVFDAMAALMLAVLLVSLGVREPPEPATGRGGVDLAGLGRRLAQAWRAPGTPALIVIVASYKLGEALADAMWKPLLFDRGFTPAQIGLWNGTYGMACSLLGSGAAGVLARRGSLAGALLWAAGLRTLGIAGEWWLSATPAAAAPAVVAVTCVEHLFGGALTTVLFALMMRHTDREIGATHYTLLASIEVWGKLPLSALSGVAAAALGYQGLFGLATALCVAFSGLVAAVRGRLEV